MRPDVEPKLTALIEHERATLDAERRNGAPPERIALLEADLAFIEKMHGDMQAIYEQILAEEVWSRYLRETQFLREQKRAAPGDS